MSYRYDLIYDYAGFILDISSYPKKSSIRDTTKYGGSFSDAFNIEKLDKWSPEIFLVTNHGTSIDAIYLGEKKRRVTTEKNKVEFANGKDITPVNFEDIREGFVQKNQDSFIKPNTRGKRIEQKEWSDLLVSIEKKFPNLFSSILEQYKEHTRKHHPKDKNGVTSFKNDSTSLALGITDIDVSSQDTYLKISKNQNVSRIPNKTQEPHENFPAVAETNMKYLDGPLPPWLMNKRPLSLREDAIIHHDSQIFEDWERLGNTPEITAQFWQNGKTVTISNYNRHTIEEQLGLDLLYYHHHYKSYILIQYKRLEQSGIYRPVDASYFKEKQNFDKLEQAVKNSHDKQITSGIIEDYRLSSEFLFFKLCEATSIDYNRNELIRGMYFPFSLWNKLLENDCTLGPRGGRKIGYDESKQRYLNNTQFMDLFKNGWIGSSDVGTKVITDLLMDSLEQKRSVVIAVSGGDRQSENQKQNNPSNFDQPSISIDSQETSNSNPYAKQKQTRTNSDQHY